MQLAQGKQCVAGTAAGMDASHGRPNAGVLLNLLTIPLKLRDVIFLGHIHDETALSGVSGGALMALGVYLAVIVISAVILYRRYRNVDV